MIASARPGPWRRLVEWLRRGLHRALELALLFLEVVGLRRPRSSADEQLELERLRLIHTEFRKLLSGNDHFLEAMAELEHKLHQGALELPTLRRRVVRASVDVYRMISSLNSISSNRYAALEPVFRSLAQRIEELFAAGTAQEAEPAPAVLELGALGVARADEAGGKLATLAELRNVLGLPAPDGFVVTTSAYRRLLQQDGRAERIRSQLMTVFSADDIPRVSAAVRAILFEGELPDWLTGEIYRAYDRLHHRVGHAPLVAVRSSALEEDADRSFAGQFLTRLGVEREGLTTAWREVIASLYGPEAMHYRRLGGLSGEGAAMAVGVVVMIDAAASGVVYSRDPRVAGSADVLIQAVHGLGLLLADGRTSPQTISVRRGEEPGSLDAGSMRWSAGHQGIRAVLAAGGPREEPLAATGETRCLTDEQALRLGGWALLLEQKLGGAQDIEWALGRDGQLHLLQSRSLTLSPAGVARPEPEPGAVVLLSGGEAACPGVGCGQTVHVDEDSALEAVPAGSVLVAPRSSPRFVRVMDRVRAIVTDAGSATGHMASIARELGIPALLSTRTATRDLPRGEVVTVDAGAGVVYRGALRICRDAEAAPSATPARRRELAGAKDRRLVEQAAELIVPLHLTDPRSPEFAPESCRTLHDLARFVHEKAYEEMFGLGSRLGESRAFSYSLDIFLPLDLYLIDLGGGLRPPLPRSRKVKPAQVASIPLASLLRGMLHEKIPRFGPRPLDTRGLLSVMLRHAVENPEAEPTFRDPCYAMISDHYLNYTSRVGYHFGVVDAFCSPAANRNYINLHFRGGAADVRRRTRRVRAIAEILRALGLHAEVIRDAVDARLSRTTQEQTAQALEMIGRLLQFMRQMDVAMVSDAAMAEVRDAFLRGDYGLTGEGK